MKTIIDIQDSKIFLGSFLTKLRNSVFVRNVVVVMSGTAAAQVIGFAVSPIISRLFSPSDFGVFGSFNSVATIIAAGVTLQYNQALMLPKEKNDAFLLFVISCLCTLVIGFLCLILCVLAPEAVNSTMKTDGMWALALLVAATVITGIKQSCQAWCVRVKAFKRTAASQVVRSVSSNGTQIGLGCINGGAAGLVFSSVFADLLATFSLIRVILSDVSVYWTRVRWGRIRQLARDYRDFPQYSASQNVLNAFSSGLPVLLLAHFYGIVVAGAYAFGMRIIQTPMGLITGSLRQVLFQKAGETQHQGRSLAPLYVKATVGLFVLVILPTLSLFSWAPELFSLVFGSQWHAAGEYASWLVLWLAVAFCNVPAVLFAALIRIQRTVFFYDLGLLAARALALFFGGLYLSALQCIVALSIVGAIMNGILILLVGHALLKKEQQQG